MLWRRAVAPFSGEGIVDKPFMLCSSGKKITQVPKQEGIFLPQWKQPTPNPNKFKSLKECFEFVSLKSLEIGSMPHRFLTLIQRFERSLELSGHFLKDFLFNLILRPGYTTPHHPCHSLDLHRPRPCLSA